MLRDQLIDQLNGGLGLALIVEEHETQRPVANAPRGVDALLEEMKPGLHRLSEKGGPAGERDDDRDIDARCVGGARRRAGESGGQQQRAEYCGGAVHGSIEHRRTS